MSLSIFRPEGKILFRANDIKSILSNEIVTEDGDSLSICIDIDKFRDFEETISYAFNTDVVKRFVYKYLYMPNSIIPEIEKKKMFTDTAIDVLGISVKVIKDNVSLVDWTYLSQFTKDESVYKHLGEINEDVEKNEDFSAFIDELGWKGEGIVIRYFVSLHGGFDNEVKATYPVVLDIYYKELKEEKEKE